MAQQNINLGTPGDASTGDYLFDAFSKAQANFSDLYTNYMPKIGGTFTGNTSYTVGANIQNVQSVKFWNQISQNNVMTGQMAADTDWTLTPTGGSNSLGYNFTADQWRINTTEILTDGSAATKIAFSTYATISSANVQLAIEELKDEVDALSLSAGAGDMLKSTYDVLNSGVVDDADKLNNQAGTYYLDRTNHTGSQLAATISDFDTAVDANAGVIANTAKVTNATHTGDVTGDTVLTIDPTAISGKPSATPVSGDFVLGWDVTDGALKQFDVATLLTGGISVDSVITDASTNPVENNAIYDALFNINAFVNTNNIEANKIIDGAGSGLDADSVDGWDSLDLVKNNGGINATTGAFEAGDIGDIAHTSFSNNNAGATLPVNYSSVWSFTGATVGRNFAFLKNNSAPNLYTGLADVSGDLSWYELWHEGNDGSGSGLDADMLDGVDSGGFLRSDVSDTFSGTQLTMTGILGMSTNADFIRLNSASANYWDIYSSSGSMVIQAKGSSNAMNFVSNASTISFTHNTSNGYTVLSGADARLICDGVLVDDEVYGVGWNTSLEVPTKNAVYDKIESLSVGGVTQTGPTQYFPLLYGASTGTGTPYTIGSRYCYYVKTGRLVHVTNVMLGINGTAPVGVLLAQLPFQAATTAGLQWVGTVKIVESTLPDTNRYDSNVQIVAGASVATFNSRSSLDGQHNFDTSYTSVDFSGAGQVVFSITYMSNS